MIRLEDGRKFKCDIPRFLRVPCHCNPDPGVEALKGGSDKLKFGCKKGWPKMVHLHKVPGFGFVYFGQCKRCRRKVGGRLVIEDADKIPESVKVLSRKNGTLIERFTW